MRFGGSVSVLFLRLVDGGVILCFLRVSMLSEGVGGIIYKISWLTLNSRGVYS